jgi:predicted PurR-regulated permease PerM
LANTVPLHQEFFLIVRNLILTTIIALLIPLISHNVTQLLHESPTYISCKTEDFHTTETQLLSLKKTIKLLEKKIISSTTTSQQDLHTLEKVEKEHKEIETVQNQREEECLKQYRSARSTYEKIYFCVALTLGIIALILSIFTKSSCISTGFMLGGFISITMGYVLCWSQLYSIVKVLSLIILLGLTVGVNRQFFLHTAGL